MDTLNSLLSIFFVVAVSGGLVLLIFKLPRAFSSMSMDVKPTKDKGLDWPIADRLTGVVGDDD